MTEQRPGVDDPDETDKPTPDQQAAQVAEEAGTASPTSAQMQGDSAASD